MSDSKKRLDGFQNVLTGLNTLRDKRRGVTTERATMLPGDAEEAWVSDWLLQRIVEVPVDDMLRSGLSVKVAALEGDSTEPEQSSDPEPEPLVPRTDADAPPVPMIAPAPKPKPGVIEVDDTPHVVAEQMNAALDDLGLVAALAEAKKLERGTGGSLILIGAFDGAASLEEPLNEESIEKVSFLTAFSAFEARPVAYYSDPKARAYGRPRVFQVNAQIMPTMYAGALPMAANVPVVNPILYVHESRVVWFPGIQSTRRERMRRGGWGQSIVERVYEPAADFRMGNQSAAALLQDFAQAVIKIKGLAELFQSNDEATFRARLEGIDLGRSVLRAMVIDAEEEFERKPTPMTGLPETLDRLANQLSAACEIPVTRLLGQAPAGLNATGDADIRAYYDMLAAVRASSVLRQAERIVRLVFRSKAGPTNGVEPASWSIQFPPLWQQTAAERAAERKTIAETDAIYINAGVLTQEEVAASRFAGDEWNPETTLDLEGRRLQHEADEEAAANQPAPPTPPGAAPVPENAPPEAETE